MNDPHEVSVWDPLVRVFHWSLVTAFLLAFVTEDDLLTVHSWAGYLVLGLVMFRWVWGVVGSRHARFSDFVSSPQAIKKYLGDVIAMRAKRHIGHNPVGGVMVMSLLIMLPLVALSGMAAYGILEFSGPLADLLRDVSPFWGELIKETHEILANVVLLLIALHLAGVLLASLQHRENLVRTMWTGKKRINE